MLRPACLAGQLETQPTTSIELATSRTESCEANPLPTQAVVSVSCIWCCVKTVRTQRNHVLTEGLFVRVLDTVTMPSHWHITWLRCGSLSVASLSREASSSISSRFVLESYLCLPIFYVVFILPWFLHVRKCFRIFEFSMTSFWHQLILVSGVDTVADWIEVKWIKLLLSVVLYVISRNLCWQRIRNFACW